MNENLFPIPKAGRITVTPERQLFGDFLLMKLHRLDGDAENLGDFLADISFRQQLEDFALPGGEIHLVVDAADHDPQ